MRGDFQVARLVMRQRAFARVAVLVAACGVAAACTSSTEPSPLKPATLEALTPTSLSGTVGTEVSVAPTVRVSDQNGNPVQGVQVSFEFFGGTTSWGTIRTSTDVNGIATAAWTLGATIGVYGVTARSAGLPKVVFTAAAEAGPVARITSFASAERSGFAGATLPYPLSVKVTDEFGNPVTGATVTFTVISGGGSIEGDIATTNSGGFAASGPWTLGPMLGEQQARAQSANAEVVFTAEALAAEECESTCAVAGQLAFVRDNQIYRVNSDGTDLVRLTNSGVNSDPAWSPDGQRIAFASNRDGNSDIYVMNADGSDVVRRTNTGRNDAPAWSPDGRKIAFSSLRDGQFGIYVMRVDEDWSSPGHLGYDRGWNAQPAWSPDGSKIAFVSDWRAFDFLFDLYVMNGDGSDVRLLLAGPFFSVDGLTYYFQPAWSPDGSTIAIVVCPYAWDNCYPNSTVAIVNADGSGLKPLELAGGFARPTWSPDGRTIAFSSSTCRDCASSIHYVTADGSQKGLIISNGHSPAWRP